VGKTARCTPLALVLLSSATWLSAATITVNSVADATANDGVCTLREAITAANTNTASGAMAGECLAGQAPLVVDTIAFNITGGCATVCTITPATSLPTVTEPVVINGYTQPGSAANTFGVGNNVVLKIEINGTTAGGTGLTLAGPGNVTIQGLVINRFGTEVLVQGPANSILGNFIGVDPTGTLDLGNTGNGIEVTSLANVIGSSAPGNRNVISGNNGAGSPAGIFLNGSGARATIENNYIGTNAAGTAAIPNGFGINAESSDSNVIGGVIIGPVPPGTSVTNVISGNGIGVRLNGADNNTIEGNHIGVDATGAVPLGNDGQGVRIDNGSGNVIGGGLDETNVISANGDVGVRVTSAANNTISHNIIGMNGAATATLGNFDGGVHVFGGSGNLIRSNVIFGNDGSTPPNLGIDLDVDEIAPDDGVTPNDAGDADTGSNGLQNFPVLTGASFAGGNTTISGTLNSTPSTAFTLEFFVSAACDPSGFGEGQIPIGTAQVATDGSGNVAFGPLVFATASPLPFATATATTPGNSTSEFSQCRTVSGVPIGATPTPTPTITAGGPTLTPTGTPTQTATATPTPTLTLTITPGGPTFTPTATPTLTITPGGPTLTPSSTATNTATPTVTLTPTLTITPGGPTFTPTTTSTVAPPSSTPTSIGGGGGPAPEGIPTLSGGMLALLAVALAGVAMLLARRG
jgi:CSLREA domain-containing protein